MQSEQVTPHPRPVGIIRVTDTIRVWNFRSNALDRVRSSAAYFVSLYCRIMRMSNRHQEWVLKNAPDKTWANLEITYLKLAMDIDADGNPAAVSYCKRRKIYKLQFILLLPAIFQHYVGSTQWWSILRYIMNGSQSTHLYWLLSAFNVKSFLLYLR